MSEKVLCEKSDLVAIADAVREATGSAENYNVSELSAATVEAISAGGSGGSVETCTLKIVCNFGGSFYGICASFDGTTSSINNFNYAYGETTTIPNVVCNSVVLVAHGNSTMATVSGDATKGYAIFDSNYNYLTPILCKSGEIVLTLNEMGLG